MKTFNVEAVVLSRRNYSDSHRFITLFSRQRGKISALANGIRKLSSKKRASLEPANHVKLSLAVGKSTPIITQAELITSFPHAKQNLIRITQTYQVLEIIDHLTVEEEPHLPIFDHLIYLLTHLGTNANHRQSIIDATKLILNELGFGLPDHNSEAAIRDHLQDITNRQLKSKKFLTLSPA